MAAGVPKPNVPSDGGALRGSFMGSGRRSGALKGDKVICQCLGDEFNGSTILGTLTDPLAHLAPAPLARS